MIPIKFLFILPSSFTNLTQHTKWSKTLLSHILQYSLKSLHVNICFLVACRGCRGDDRDEYKVHCEPSKGPANKTILWVGLAQVLSLSLTKLYLSSFFVFAKLKNVSHDILLHLHICAMSVWYFYCIYIAFVLYL